MSLIPANPVTQEDLSKWYEMQRNLKALKAAEMLLRMKIFGALFPDPKEGVNSTPLADGWVLKATHAIDRKVDIATFSALKESFIERGLNPDELVRYKPELALPVYRKLSEEHQLIFDECMTVKPGSPSLEIVLPASAKAKQEEQAQAKADPVQQATTADAVAKAQAALLAGK